MKRGRAFLVGLSFALCSQVSAFHVAAGGFRRGEQHQKFLSGAPQGLDRAQQRSLLAMSIRRDEPLHTRGQPKQRGPSALPASRKHINLEGGDSQGTYYRGLGVRPMGDQPYLSQHQRWQDGDSSSSSSSSSMKMSASIAPGEPEEPTNVEVVVEKVQDAVRQSKEMDKIINVGVAACIALAVVAKVVFLSLPSSRGWTTGEFFMRIGFDNWDVYSETLRQHPIAVKAATSCSVYAIGDIVAQISSGVLVEDVDRRRIIFSAIAGLIGHGPLSHFWYGISEAGFDKIGWNDSWWVFLPKVAVDQTVWGPIWNAMYILLLGLLNKEGLEKVVKDVKETSLPLLISGLKLWPFAHLVTYGLIPVENRLLWVDLVEILWVTILSTQAAEQQLVAGKEPDADKTDV